MCWGAAVADFVLFRSERQLVEQTDYNRLWSINSAECSVAISAAIGLVGNRKDIEQLIDESSFILDTGLRQQSHIGRRLHRPIGVQL